MADKGKKGEVYVEPGELRTMRDPRSGKLKEVDMSLAALSRTMENIRKCAEIINAPDTSFEMSMNRFSYIEELVLDHAQFSPRLQNLQIRIGNRTIEVVKNFEELHEARMNFAKNHYLTRARADIAKAMRTTPTQRKAMLEKVLEFLKRGKEVYLHKDEETDQLIAEIETALS